MADRPILFSGPMVRALLAGTKTQTRRVIKPQPPEGVMRHCWYSAPRYGFTADPEVPTAQWHVVRLAAYRGDRLWAREAHALVPASAYRCSEGVQQTINPADKDDAAVYRADWERSAPPWRPSIHMPRWASRLTLIVEAVKVERLQDISEADAIAEGLSIRGRPEGGSAPLRLYHIDDGHHHPDPRQAYRGLWNHINGPRSNGPGSWEANPWIAAYTFRVISQNIDAISP